MTNVATALNKFYNGFGIPAFIEDHVPDDAKLPYITYTVSVPDWRYPVSLQARVWYHGDSMVEINSKVDDISQAIGEGISLPSGNGAVYLFKGNPFAQYQPLDNPDVRVVYLNLSMHGLTN